MKSITTLNYKLLTYGIFIYTLVFNISITVNAADVYIDTNGAIYIYASDALDAAYAKGYIHAKENPFYHINALANSCQTASLLENDKELRAANLFPPLTINPETGEPRLWDMKTNEPSRDVRIDLDVFHHYWGLNEFADQLWNDLANPARLEFDEYVKGWNDYILANQVTLAIKYPLRGKSFSIPAPRKGFLVWQAMLGERASIPAQLGKFLEAIDNKSISTFKPTLGKSLIPASNSTMIMTPMLADGLVAHGEDMHIPESPEISSLVFFVQYPDPTDSSKMFTSAGMNFPLEYYPKLGTFFRPGDAGNAGSAVAFSYTAKASVGFLQGTVNQDPNNPQHYLDWNGVSQLILDEVITIPVKDKEPFSFVRRKTNTGLGIVVRSDPNTGIFFVYLRPRLYDFVTLTAQVKEARNFDEVITALADPQDGVPFIGALSFNISTVEAAKSSVAKSVATMGSATLGFVPNWENTELTHIGILDFSKLENKFDGFLPIEKVQTTVLRSDDPGNQQFFFAETNSHPETRVLNPLAVSPANVNDWIHYGIPGPVHHKRSFYTLNLLPELLLNNSGGSNSIMFDDFLWNVVMNRHNVELENEIKIIRNSIMKHLASIFIINGYYDADLAQRVSSVVLYLVNTYAFGWGANPQTNNTLEGAFTHHLDFVFKDFVKNFKGPEKQELKDFRNSLAIGKTILSLEAGRRVVQVLDQTFYDFNAYFGSNSAVLGDVAVVCTFTTFSPTSGSAIKKNVYLLSPLDSICVWQVEN